MSKEIVKILKDALAEKNRVKEESDRKEFISSAAQKLLDSLSPEDRKSLMDSVGKDIIKSLDPLLSEIAKQSRLSNEEIKGILSDIKWPDVSYQAPEVNVPEIKIPEIKVPEVRIPPIKFPEIKMPEEMDIRGWVQLQGVDLAHPLPVQLRDAQGNPVKLFEGLTQIVSGGGGKADFFTVKGFSQSAYSELMNADGRLRVSVETGGSGLTDAELRASSVPVAQASGAKWSTEATIVGTVAVSGITNSVAATLLNGDGNSLDPRDRNWTITETVAVSGSLDTAKASGIARQTNPTPVSDGDNQRIALDDLGRQLVRPVQVRDLITTAYTSLINGTETTLVAAVAGSYLDLVYIMGANNSDAAVTVDIRAVTAGNVVMTLQIPANGTAGIACPVPLPQGDTGNNWTADIGDITGTTVYLTALFSKEI